MNLLLFSVDFIGMPFRVKKALKPFSFLTAHDAVFTGHFLGIVQEYVKFFSGCVKNILLTQNFVKLEKTG